MMDSVLPPIPMCRTNFWLHCPTVRPTDRSTLEIVFKPDPTVWDGRFSNNGWLQELPKPISKLTWDNAALVSPKLALHYGLQNNDVVELAFKGRSVHAPVWIMPGQAETPSRSTSATGARRRGESEMGRE